MTKENITKEEIMISPVVLFVYNRPIHTQRTVEALSKNILADESDLYIFSDGARKSVDIDSVNKVRNYLKTIKGFRSVKVFESHENNGLSKAIINGVNTILSQAESIIVLEDDLITSPYFLSFMNQALTLYRDDRKVVCINAYMYPVGVDMPQSFFIRGADCQGWATWRRGWQTFNPNGKLLLNELRKRKLVRDFDYNNSYAFSRMLSHQSKGLVESWAIRWYASAFLKDKLTLYPGKSLIKNIGFDNTGVNSSDWDKKRYNTDVSLDEIKLIRIESKENEIARKVIGNYFLKTQKPILLKIKHKLLSFFK